MKCDEVQPLQGAYLDSELDARTTLEIQQHLKSCPECTRLFTEEQNFQTWVDARLRDGKKSESLWAETERAVLEAAREDKSPSVSRRSTPQEGWPEILTSLTNRLRAVWSGAPRAWTGIAVAWLLILVLNLAARENESMPLARQPTPSVSQLRFALRQKQSLLVELAVAAEASASGKAKAAAPSPRSQRQENNLRT